MIILLCILYGVSLILYTRRSLREGFTAQLALKAATSTLFILIACACFLKTQGNRVYFLLMLCAFFCSLVGDVFIQMQRRRDANAKVALICGASAFFAAHCLYSAAFMLLAPLSAIDPVVFCFLFTSMSLVFSTLRLDFERYTLPCTLYLAAILFMLTKALSVWYSGGGSLVALLLASGGTLFAISDFLLTLKNFYPPCRHSKPISAGVTITYYLAQLMFALSILYV